MFIIKFYVQDGGLMSYGVDFSWLMRRGFLLWQRFYAARSPLICALNRWTALSSS